jgi:hypothetical protein
MAAVGDPSGPHPCPLAGPRPFTGLSEHSSGEERGTKRASKLGNGRRGRVPPKERSISRVKTCRERESSNSSSRAKGNEQWLSAIFPAFSRACTVPDGMAARAHTRHNGSSPLPSFLRRSRSPMHQCAEAEQKQPPSMPTIHLSVAKLARLPHEKLLAR